MERILVPLDGSELSEHAVPVAARLARALGARVILLRVVPPPRVSVPETAGDLPPLVDLEERQADEYLRAHEPAFAGIPVERVLRHLITGSVTEAVLRSGLAPVIAVRPVPTASTARR